MKQLVLGVEPRNWPASYCLEAKRAELLLHHRAIARHQFDTQSLRPYHTAEPLPYQHIHQPRFCRLELESPKGTSAIGHDAIGLLVDRVWYCGEADFVRRLGRNIGQAWIG